MSVFFYKKIKEIASHVDSSSLNLSVLRIASIEYTDLKVFFCQTGGIKNKFAIVLKLIKLAHHIFWHSEFIEKFLDMFFVNDIALLCFVS